MAKKVKKPQELPAKEAAAVAALEKFNKAHEGKTLTDAQKKERKALRDAVSAEKFVRIANKRLPKVLAGIEAIGNLAAYVHNAAQTKAIADALQDRVTTVKRKLEGAKESATVFTIPGTDAEQ